MPAKVSLNAYFERIGFSGSIAPTLATLEQLHALHPASIPFENLDSLIGLAPVLDQPSLERKMLAQRRGGFCFEQNLMFMRVLQDLDYTVRPILTRVVWSDPRAVDGPPTHLALLVEINGQNYLADVGFGGQTTTGPVRLRDGAEQSTPHESFRLIQAESQWTLETRIGDEWRALYVFTTDAATDDQIAALNTQIGSDPDSPFTFELRVSMAPPGQRLKLHNTSLTIQPVGGEAQKREITTLEGLRSVLTTEFGMVLPNDERLEQALSRFLPLPPDTPDEAPL
jgi:N-hydroxyarylamine O-acetyltransferase